MHYYLAVYSRNEVITVKEITESSRERVERHPGGQLIYAIVTAENLDAAISRANELTIRKEGEESD